jgi:pyruvate dehydrogenase E2 component (dihydrolipoamide acetyltransferase)
MSHFEKEQRLGSWRKISLHTWGTPSDPTVYGMIDVDVSRALAYIAKLRQKTSAHVTLTHLVGKAVALGIRERPEVNAIIRRGRHFYRRDTVDVFFQVALDGGTDLSGAKISRADEKSVVEIAEELSKKAERVRAHEDKSAMQRSNELLNRLPARVRGTLLGLGGYLSYDLGLDLRFAGIPYDAFGSAMVTNVGVFGLPSGFAPLVPFARTPILLTIGVVEERPVAVEGRVEVRPIVTIGGTFDHRILDGYQAGKLAQRFRAVLADPEKELG